MSSNSDSMTSDTPAPAWNPYAQGAINSDGFSRIVPQDPTASRPRSSNQNPFANPETASDGFQTLPRPAQAAYQGVSRSGNLEVLLRAFFHHANVPASAKQANGSLRLSRTWAINMLGQDQFQRAHNGQLVLKMGSELKDRAQGRYRLPDKIIDWLDDEEADEELAVPAAIVRQYWTRPRYTD